MKLFNESKAKFKSVFIEILRNFNSYEIDEAALPAYAHKNPLIDYLFWSRLKSAYSYANKGERKDILDFGCGSGVLSYMLAKKGHDVTAVDLDLSPLKLVQEKIEFPESINFIEGDIIHSYLPDNSFDLILAMDVLEHVDNLNNYIIEFHRILRPGGAIIISGPTENILYKIGRRIAGNQFTGDYHVSNISYIKNEFNRRLKVRSLKKLFYPFVLFEIFEAKLKIGSKKVSTSPSQLVYEEHVSV